MPAEPKPIALENYLIDMTCQYALSGCNDDQKIKYYVRHRQIHASYKHMADTWESHVPPQDLYVTTYNRWGVPTKAQGFRWQPGEGTQELDVLMPHEGPREILDYARKQDPDNFAAFKAIHDQQMAEYLKQHTNLAETQTTDAFQQTKQDATQPLLARLLKKIWKLIP